MCEFNLQLKSWNSNASNWSFAKSPSSLRCALAPAVRNGDWCDETIATEMADCEHKSSFLNIISIDLLTSQRYGKTFPVEPISRLPIKKRNAANAQYC